MFFDSFLMDPPLAPRPKGRGCKQEHKAESASSYQRSNHGVVSSSPIQLNPTSQAVSAHEGVTSPTNNNPINNAVSVNEGENSRINSNQTHDAVSAHERATFLVNNSLPNNAISAFKGDILAQQESVSAHCSNAVLNS
jgi:hypothetical protein